MKCRVSLWVPTAVNQPRTNQRSPASAEFPSAPDLHPQQCSKHDGGSHREQDAPGSSTYGVVAGAWRITIDVGSAASKHASRYACPMGSRLIWNACAERPPVQRDDAFVKAGEAALMLGNRDQLEAAVAIAGNVAPDRAAIGDDRFAASAVALVGLPSGLDGLCR